MADISNQIFTPTNYTDFFSTLNRYPDGTIFAGGTELLCGQGKRNFSLPACLIELSALEDLYRISRTERYLEIGSMVSLNEILRLGKVLPPILRDTISAIANPGIRNLGTIGGNICSRKRYMDCFAPLVALDARLELRSASNSRWVGIARFLPSSAEIGVPELLTRLRIPLEQWDYHHYQRFGHEHLLDPQGASFAFLARVQKNVLSDIRLSFAGEILLRDRDLDATLIGKTLPLESRDVQAFSDNWRLRATQAGLLHGIMLDRFLNLIEHCLHDMNSFQYYG